MPDDAQKLDRVKEILRLEWDPIGVGEMPGAFDEYDFYAVDIVDAFNSRTTVDDIEQTLRSAIARMGLTPIPKRDKRVAALILATLR